MGKKYFQDLIYFIKNQYVDKICYPPSDLIFSAFNHCSLDNIKVVIIGQDPYHGPNQANGLCFSVDSKLKNPPSLINIFKEKQIFIGKEMAFTCGSGVTACILGLANSIISGKKPIIYDGSWAEYGLN